MRCCPAPSSVCGLSRLQEEVEDAEGEGVERKPCDSVELGEKVLVYNSQWEDPEVVAKNDGFGAALMMGEVIKCGKVSSHG